MADPRIHRVHYHVFQDAIDAAQFAERMLMRCAPHDRPVRMTGGSSAGIEGVRILWAGGEPIAQATLFTDDLNQTLVTVVALK
ncbi:hypothetical protein HOT99_gp160 [Caulobacter phage CcrBL10]|uniref:Uncharacterized protein n=1 Tax=Caulobacter phage CcrBL10 TaxID=2283269 RepID=A0A385ECB6_9CAUD|nr:hypothetical protein HOT99_gp160 [Caulobacter phage CcrBL10]AXQ68457.1 hypothetical protein CcrBL10_gp253 [Caulobacter phage CcrBL10]